MCARSSEALQRPSKIPGNGQYAPPFLSGGNGTLYVNIDSKLAFDRAVFTSTSFEFDNLAFNPTAVPEPASLALFGAGLLGLGFTRRVGRRS